MKLIVVATDGSTGGNKAVDYSSNLAKALDYPLIILTVCGEHEYRALEKTSSQKHTIAEEVDQFANQILISSKARAEEIIGKPVRIEMRWGDPASEILRTAEETKCEILVLGRRGRGLIKNLLIGSVSQKIVSLAPCATVVIP